MLRAIVCGLVFVATLSSFASETTKGMKKDYESFKTEMSAQLDSVERQIEDLRLKAKQKGSSTQEETAASLEKTRAKLKAELASMKDNGKDGWSSFKKSFAESVDKLNTKIQTAVKD
ncbi:MAG: hypothetical protein H7256_10790 [Bdellovibrio sp.]|nr:hypothetical protein [Bdellovibrio sp.]